jgi:hypothetical protein
MSALPEVFTMPEAADRLRISRRSLQELIKAYPHYMQNGVKKLFSADDILALMQAMRQEADKCRSSSIPRAPAKVRTGLSAGRISASTWTRARALLTKPSRKS